VSTVKQLLLLRRTDGHQ